MSKNERYVYLENKSLKTTFETIILHGYDNEIELSFQEEYEEEEEKEEIDEIPCQKLFPIESDELCNAFLESIYISLEGERSTNSNANDIVCRYMHFLTCCSQHGL